MKALLGHMSTSMIGRYSHIRDAEKREAVEGLKLATVVFWGTRRIPQSRAKAQIESCR